MKVNFKGVRTKAQLEWLRWLDCERFRKDVGNKNSRGETRRFGGTFRIWEPDGSSVVHTGSVVLRDNYIWGSIEELVEWKFKTL